MKKTILIICTTVFMLGCNNKKDSADNAVNKMAPAEASAETTENINYAYLPASHPADNWNRGDMKNAAMVLQSLKDWEMGKVDEALTPFADSIQWVGDGFNRKMSKADLKKVMDDEKLNRKAVKIDMDDYETVVSNIIKRTG